MTHKKTIQLPMLIAAVTLCFLPFMFSNGCMFDPGTTSNTSDSTTYRVNGKVYTTESKFLAGIHVSLYDSVNSIRSSVSITDTNGSYSISFPYIKQRLLTIDYVVPTSLSDLYVGKRDTLHFDDNYFKFSFIKYHEAIVQSK
ncbi:MAG: hypothetical protein GX639_03955 [Fibrobacter sp.]|nr:hypothetical protein [Fibrobacter sp.]